MSGSKSVAQLFLFLLCFSCSQKGIIVCSDNKLRCEKYNEVLKSIGLNPLGIVENKKNSLWVSAAESGQAIKAINLVNNYFVEQDLFDQGNLTEKFVPILKSNSLDLSKVNSVLVSIPGVFSVDCIEKSTINEASKINCSISFLSSILSQSQIEEHLKLHALNDMLAFSYVDLTQALALIGLTSGEQNKANYELIKLSPFSFHVPYAEKEIAGIQLILVLGVFLFSGIILGFWLGTKERTHGRKSI